MSEGQMELVCQQWEESERGWGVRPDGYSLHLTEADRVEYIHHYTKDRNPHLVPDEYDRPCGDPYLAHLAEDDERVTKVKDNSDQHGVRFYDRARPEPPESARGVWRSHKR